VRAVSARASEDGVVGGGRVPCAQCRASGVSFVVAPGGGPLVAMCVERCGCVGKSYRGNFCARIAGDMLVHTYPQKETRTRMARDTFTETARTISCAASHKARAYGLARTPHVTCPLHCLRSRWQHALRHGTPNTRRIGSRTMQERENAAAWPSICCCALTPRARPSDQCRAAAAASKARLHATSSDRDGSIFLSEILFLGHV
jgi:hypothetical protein